jgi:hypothetical protein
MAKRNIEDMSYVELKQLHKQVKKHMRRKYKRETYARAFEIAAERFKKEFGVSIDYARSAYYFRD